MAILTGLTISGGGITIVGGMPPTDPYFMYNTLLLPGNGTNGAQNNTFTDGSTNSLAITRNGTTIQGTFSPYGGNWSNYFDGASYLTVPAGTAFAPGTGDFTVEGWINPSGLMSSYGMIYGQTYSGANYFTIFATDGSIKFININATYSSGANLWTVGSWNHFAVVRSGGTLTVYLNGVPGTSAADAYNYTEITVLPTIGRYTHTGSNFFYGYISNLRYVKGTAVYTSAFTSPTTPLTPITNTSLLTCADNRLIDDSINNFTVTRNGDVSVQRFSPFSPSSITPTSYSGYFDGTGDYLNAPSNVVFGFGTGDFTIEGWFYFTGIIGTYQRPWWFGDDNDNIEINASVIRVGGASQGTLITGGTTIVASTWYHIALTRASGSYKLWLNGSQQGSTATNSYNSSARTFTAMATSGGSNPSTGYVSNLRIVKGTAVYTTTFTPSTTPLTAISGTSLLTLQSTTFIDNSTNNLTLTPVGNSQPTQQNPFGFTTATTNGYTSNTIGGSGYFDGVGDYLVTAADSALALATNAADFTIECWVYNKGYAGSQYGRGICIYYPSAGYGSNRLMFRLSSGADHINVYLLANSSAEFGGSGAEGAATITPNAWTHVALVRNAGVFYVYVNGVIDITVNSSSAASSIPFTTFNMFEIGRTQDGTSPDWFGNISNYRFVRGTAVYTSNFVPPSQPITAVTNTALLLDMTNAGIIDNAMMNNLDTLGNAQISTTQSQFGGSSMYFDGTGDYLLIPTTVALAFPGDYTLECWVYLNSVSGNQGVYSSIDNSGDSNQGIAISFSNTSFLATSYISGGDAITHQTAVTTGQWYHLAMVRSDSTTKSYLNGVQSTGTTTSTYSLTQSGSTIGSAYPGTNPLNGYINDLRITKGYARYTATFTPPTTAFPVN
jgi:hypothetical protein